MSIWKNVLCLFFDHKYRVAQELPPFSRRLGCTRCSEAFAMNDDARCLVSWGPEFHRLYESHGVKIVYQPWEFGGESLHAAGER